MSEDQRPPRALKIVALLFALGGLSSMLKMAMGLFSGDLKIDLGVFGLWIASGLLRFEPGAYKWAKRFIWFDLIVIDIITIVSGLLRSQGNSEPSIKLFGSEVGMATGVAYLLSMAAISLWKLRVLKRPEVEALFKDEKELTTFVKTKASRISVTDKKEPQLGHGNPANGLNLKRPQSESAPAHLETVRDD